MFAIDVRTNIAEVLRTLDASKKQIQQATLSAIDRTADGAKTRMTRSIASDYRLSYSFVRERLRVNRARRNGVYAFTATLIGNPNGSNKRSMNVIHFALSKLSGSEKKAWRKQAGKGGLISRPQLPLQIKRTGGRVYIKGAFVGNDGRTVFRRVGKSRLPIEPVQTIGVPSMFASKKNVGDIQAWVQDNFNRIFEQQLRFRLGQGR